MTRQILFIQGAGSDGAHAADEPLARSLRARLGDGYSVRFPAMPDEDEPDYATWKRVIEAELTQLGAGVILVGHSIGGSVLVRAVVDGLAAPPPAALFVIAAPFWHDHHFWRWDDVALPADAAVRFPAGLPLFLYHGIDDRSVPVDHANMYAAALPQALLRRLTARDHQLNEDLDEVAQDIARLTGTPAAPY